MRRKEYGRSNQERKEADRPFNKVQLNLWYLFGGLNEREMEKKTTDKKSRPRKDM